MSQPFPAVLGGRWSALEGGYQSNDSNGLRLPSPTAYGNLAAWYDVSDYSSLVVDGSNRVSLIADKSGNSATNCLCINGQAISNAATSPDSSALSITGSIDIIARFSCAWTTVNGQVVSKENGGAQRSYALWAGVGGGRLAFAYFNDGSTQRLATCTAGVPFSDLNAGWVRVTYNSSNGEVKFYTAPNAATVPSSWSQLGATVTITSGAIFDSTTQLAIGMRADLAVAGTAVAGCVYRVQIWNGLSDAGGTLAFDANFATASKLATSFTESSSNAATVTINSSGDLGARICGERDLVQLTASKQPVYLPWSGTNYGWLNGVTGSNFTTPDSAILSPAGDVTLVASAALNDWTPSADQFLVAKWGTGGAGISTESRDYILYVRTDGRLEFIYTADGLTVTGRIATSSVATGFTDGQTGWVRAAYASATGKVNFSTSSDGVTWSALGAEQTITSGTINAGGSRLIVGAGTLSGTPISGRVFRAQVYDGSTLVADFNPALYTSGTTFTASTGETWTLNGGATIVNRTSVYFDGSDDYMKAAAFSLSQPETVYFTGQQVSWTVGDSVYDGGTDAAMTLQQRTASVSPNVAIFAGSYVGNITDWAIGETAVITGVYNGASSATKKNRGTELTGNVGALNPNGFTLGARGGISSYGNVRANEVAIYSAAHSTSVQDRVIQYAGRKWGISGV